MVWFTFPDLGNSQDSFGSSKDHHRDFTNNRGNIAHSDSLPPKNTFTNLNYDLMMLENMTLDNDTRDELTQFAVGLIQEEIYKDVKRISLIQEDNRYYNWYRGYTPITLPYWGLQNPGITHCLHKECAEERLRDVVKLVDQNTLSRL